MMEYSNSEDEPTLAHGLAAGAALFEPILNDLRKNALGE